ncbi:hypothetical protein Pelo_2380 [Pelomyxa schiedti]|nr:hypothetical protein Pelo_2380 [Pelomyxa schiedti]
MAGTTVNAVIETVVGYSLFSVTDLGDSYRVDLLGTHNFADDEEVLVELKSVTEGELGPSLRSFLSSVAAPACRETGAPMSVSGASLAHFVSSELGITCASSAVSLEVERSIRQSLDQLLPESCSVSRVVSLAVKLYSELLDRYPAAEEENSESEPNHEEERENDGLQWGENAEGDEWQEGADEFDWYEDIEEEQEGECAQYETLCGLNFQCSDGHTTTASSVNDPCTEELKDIHTLPSLEQEPLPCALILFETSAGYALFDVASKEGELAIISLNSLREFPSLEVALEEFCSIEKGEIGALLLQFINDTVIPSAKLLDRPVGVAEYKLATALRGLGLDCYCTCAVAEMCREIREQLSKFIPQFKDTTLALSHAAATAKIITLPRNECEETLKKIESLEQSISSEFSSLVDMSWDYFPELIYIISDPELFCNVLKRLDFQDDISEIDLSDILNPDLEAYVKEAAFFSDGCAFLPASRGECLANIDSILSLITTKRELQQRVELAQQHAGPVKKALDTEAILAAEKALFAALKRNPESAGLEFSKLTGFTENMDLS